MLSARKLLFVWMLAMVLCSCSNVDNIRVEDKDAKSYSLMLEKSIKNTDFVVFVEHQSVKGAGEQYFPENTYDEVVEGEFVQMLRPAVTTKNNFSLKSNALGFEWHWFEWQYFGMNISAMYKNLSRDLEVIQPSNVRKNLDSSESTISQKLEIYIPLKNGWRLAAYTTAFNTSNEELAVNYMALEYDYKKSVEIGLGYREWFYTYTADETQVVFDPSQLNFNKYSDIDLTAKGVDLTVKFKF